MVESTNKHVIEATGTYKKIAALLEQWVENHKGETFDLDTVYRQLQIFNRENRNYITTILSKLVHKGVLEKTNRIYRYIDNTCKHIDWVSASENNTLDVHWPYGIKDNSKFGFDGRVIVSPGDIIVIAGTSNMGKTAFCLNFLWENMDSFPCTLMGNEYTAGKFKRRVKRMDWKNPLKEDGSPKFELIERRSGWKDIIRPNNINIIDWVNLEDNFYQIGKVIEGIQEPLDGGIALISIQKDETKQMGLGGHFSEDLASFYLLVDYQRLTIRKVKEWKEWNPNKKIYGFEISDGGTKFHNIRQIIKCKQCWGSGHTKGGECDKCQGTGYVDADEV